MEAWMAGKLAQSQNYHWGVVNARAQRSSG